jgi:hypothetical protein
VRNSDAVHPVLALGLLALIIVATPFACVVSNDNLQRATKPLGITEAKVTGFSWFGCGEDYVTHGEFEGKSAKGEPVSGVVCCGVFKGCTLKF